MGYILFIVIFLIYLNVRQIKKVTLYQARKQGYPKTIISSIIDSISEYQYERKKGKKKYEEEKLPFD